MADAAEQTLLNEPYNLILNIFGSKPVFVNQRNDYDGIILTTRPLLGPLLFDNVTSDARDHCANERTFLSWLRLSTYMAIVSVAIIISFHLRREPSRLELRMALPFGIIFWFLSLACLLSGVFNYYHTVMQYSKRSAIVQSGWKTEMVFTVVATAIIAACILFLSTKASTKALSNTIVPTLF